ncbi:uncharacterized protein J4E79_004999 [Alternaria viburni]|uniref:uncharacterized protein n=1 Tax=Alternaria viburni TaxID=566460 RepID=UPI0020C5708C|nr:uncharacterized protein J4E79_004999 [Alternaria viburni]KAI4661188.1 hypothetical protein J4E79_004999 [Alternaria viburni]
MPRQLPWASKSGGSRTQAKPASSRKATKARATADIDDDFFDGTVLADSSRSRTRSNGSDDDLPGLPTTPTRPRTKTRTKEALGKKRGGSSSPPPIDELEAPHVEKMHKCLSKFDLRDDEWMMVEDEFLETAKLFSRHLHIAEYEKLKAMIEEKKKEAAEVTRPVVANAKRSTSGEMKEKARVQELKQKEAIRDVFASQEDEDDQEGRAVLSNRSHLASSFMASRHVATTSKYATQDSDYDSDDLDAPRPSAKPVSRSTTTPTPVRNSSAAKGQKSASSPAPNPNPVFAKPAPPTPAAKSRSRISRATPFDMLDDLVPTKKSKALSGSSPQQPVETSHTTRASSVSKYSQSFDSVDDRGNAKLGRSNASFNENASVRDPGGSGGNSGVSKETSERIAKRKAERERNEKERKRKAADLDDVPTFLF